MAPVTRKRVRAFHRAPRRAPDGSAFTKCNSCGVSVPVALLDMHDCNEKKEVKRFKGNSKPSIPQNICNPEQPRSPFMFFMESYSKSCTGRALVEINREAYEKWKKMPSEERLPYISQAQKVENAYLKVLHQEEIQLSQEKDDEADSAKVGKGTKLRDCFEHSEDYYSDSEGDECFGKMMFPWNITSKLF